MSISGEDELRRDTVLDLAHGHQEENQEQQKQLAQETRCAQEFEKRCFERIAKSYGEDKKNKNSKDKIEGAIFFNQECEECDFAQGGWSNGAAE